MNVQGEDNEQAYREKTIIAYCNFLLKIQEITRNRNLYEEFQNVKDTSNEDAFAKFARQTALAITGVLTQNLSNIETIVSQTQNENTQMLFNCLNLGLNYMVQYSQCEEDELFKICLDFWKFFTESLFEKLQLSPDGLRSTNMYPEILS